MRQAYYFILLLLSLALYTVKAVELEVWKENPYWNEVRWGAHVQLNKPPTNGQVIKLAKDAHKSMIAKGNYDQRHASEVPRVMSAWAVGNEVWLSSSVKGTLLIYKTPTDEGGKGGMYDGKGEVPESLRHAIDNCRNNIILKQAQHTNNAQCGELYAIFSFLRTRGHTMDELGPNNKAKIVAWERDPYTKEKGIKPPCTADPDYEYPMDFGCHEVLNEFSPKENPTIDIITSGSPESYDEIIVACNPKSIWCDD